MSTESSIIIFLLCWVIAMACVLPLDLVMLLLCLGLFVALVFYHSLNG